MNSQALEPKPKENRAMRFKRIQWMVGLSLCTAVLASSVKMADDDRDFGLKTERLLKAHSEQLFGIAQPLEESALGPYTGLDSSLAVIVAKGLNVTVVSTATHSLNDQMALWPDDNSPTHIIIAVEDGTSG